MTITTDAVVIGAGVVGLAVARALSAGGMETVVLERNAGIGEETSSRNSEVVHAGIYYPPGSLKAVTCVQGRSLLYAHAESHGVAHRRCGKLIVAGDERGLERLAALKSTAERCGVTDLRTLGPAEVAELEPEVRCAGGLYSPSSGIIDTHQLMLSLQGDLEKHGGHVVLRSPVIEGRLGIRDRHRLTIGGGAETEIATRIVVNAAGLEAGRVGARLAGWPSDRMPAQYYAKGHYFTYTGPPPFRHLVYPLPELGGLGIHATIDLAGQVRFGPDVAWIEVPDYHFDTSTKSAFLSAIKPYFPGLDRHRLQPGYTGIRPKLTDSSGPPRDFAILGPAEHGIPGFCSLHGIESPGLTACLALAERVRKQVAGSIS
jgi:L-2-hydroxyglutarate oxidase LhgO